MHNNNYLFSITILLIYCNIFALIGSGNGRANGIAPPLMALKAPERNVVSVCWEQWNRHHHIVSCYDVLSLSLVPNPVQHITLHQQVMEGVMGVLLTWQVREKY